MTGGSGNKGNNEDPIHLKYKNALSKLKVVTLVDKNTKKEIKVYIEKAYLEWDNYLTCNEKDYKPDLKFKIYKTEPEEYKYRWKGYLYLEVENTSPVDPKKSIDFVVEEKPLFEYTINKNSINYKEEDITKHFEGRCIYGKWINDCEIMLKNKWHDTKKGNISSKIDDVWYTIYKKEGTDYYLMIKGDGTYVFDPHGRKITNIDWAKKIAKYRALLDYKERLKKKE